MTFRHVRLTAILLLMIPIMLGYQNCSNPFPSVATSLSESDGSNLNPPNLSDAELKGKLIYEQSCKACHGVLENSILRDKSAPEITLAISHVPSMAGLTALANNGRDLEALEAYLASPIACPSTPRKWSAARLTASQIYYTLFDLLGVRIDRQLLPVDGIRGSFQNNLDLQFDTSTLQSYLDFVSGSTSVLLPAFKTRFVSCTASDVACLRTGFGNFAQKAYRTTLTTAEIEAHYQVFVASKAVGATHDEALTDVMTYILVSSRFLYPFEDNRAAGTAPAAREIANRLALMIWSSVPDDTLIARATDGSLLTEAGIKTQIDRMLKDAKGERFQRVFLAGWAGLRTYFANEPSSGTMNFNYQKETLTFLDNALRTNANANDLVSANYTYVNQALATQYGLTGTFNSTFAKTTLAPQTSRMGLLTHGSFLTTVANSTFATVYKRGNHVLKYMMCNPTPPPPPEVMPVDPTVPGMGMTEAELARLHRSKSSSCVACHARMDPIGLSLSMFDQNAALKPSFAPVARDLATMPDGSVLGSPEELAKYLNRGNKLQACFVTGLSTYVYSGYSISDVRCVKESYHNRINEGPKPLADWIMSVVSDSMLKAK